MCRERYQALDGDGAFRNGGRWNSPGHAVVYLAESASLAALEMLVHVDPEDAPDDLVLLEVSIPTDATIESLDVGSLPPNWRATSPPPACQALGDDWLMRQATLGLWLPSVILPTERNLLINPAHPRMSDVRVMSETPFQFDPRLLG